MPFLVDSPEHGVHAERAGRAPARPPGVLGGSRPARAAEGRLSRCPARRQQARVLAAHRNRPRTGPGAARRDRDEHPRARSTDVRAATGDWRRMRAKALDAASGLGRATVRGQKSEVREARALLEWMEDNHFTFLGYREYRLRRGPRRDRLVPVPAFRTRDHARRGRAQAEDDRAHRAKCAVSRVRRNRSSSPRRTRSPRSTGPLISTTSASRPTTRPGVSPASGGSSACGPRPPTAAALPRSRSCATRWSA